MTDVAEYEARVEKGLYFAESMGTMLRTLSAELVRQQMPDTLIDAMDRAAKELEQAVEELRPPEEGQGD